MSGAVKGTVSGAAVLDTLDHNGHDSFIESYEQWARAAAVNGRDVRPTTQRRAELLDALPLGDLTSKTCVDYGVGVRGFGASFPKLQRCARAIAVDVARAALESSARQPGCARECLYLTSRGDRIELDTGSADVFYAGDSLEHVENAEVFFEEVHRILKPGGLLVLTTNLQPADAPYQRAAAAPPPGKPSMVTSLRTVPRRAMSRLGRVVRSNPSLHRLARFFKRLVTRQGAAAPVAAGLAATVAAQLEPIGALTRKELHRYLAPRFEIVAEHGEESPESGGPVVLLARRRDDYRPGAGFRQHRYHHEWPHLDYHGGPWEVIGLQGAMTGRLGLGGPESWLTFEAEGTDLVLYFWASRWGGEAVVEVDGAAQTVNLYSPTGRFKRVHVAGLAPGRHSVRIAGTGSHDARSVSTQVIFYEAVAYQREDGSPSIHQPARVRPARPAAEIAALKRRVAARDWFHTIDLGDGIVTRGGDHSPSKVGYLGIPKSLDGLDVLDIGAYDGFFSFLSESRGARRVVAADYYCWCYGGMATKDGFDLAKAALGSNVEEKYLRVEDLAPEGVGTFDLVLFLGVLYHAPDMIRYLRIVRSLCRHQLILETEIDAEDYPLPAAVFYPAATLNNDASNFWGPNTQCVLAMLREVGFSRVELHCTFNMVHRPGRAFHRAVFHAFV